MLVLSEEQKMIQESASRFMDDQFPFSRRQQITLSDDGFDRDLWRQFAELGWLALSIDESCGGIGGSLVDAALVHQQMGRVLMCSPYLNCLGGAATALNLSANESLKTEQLGALAAGEAIISCGLYESENIDDTPVTRARRSGSTLLVNGCKRLVPWGAQVDSVIVSVIVDDTPHLVLIPTNSPGIKIRPYRLYDGSRAADMEFSDVKAEEDWIVGRCDSNTLNRIVDREIAMMAMEASAVMWAIHDQTLEYMKTREQFGQTLSTMQALQHRMVDIYVNCQLAQSMAEQSITAVCHDTGNGHSTVQVSATKAFIGEKSRFTGKEGIQLHGGIGMTNDLPIGHYFKRLEAIDRIHGDADWHRNRYSRLSQPES